MGLIALVEFIKTQTKARPGNILGTNMYGRVWAGDQPWCRSWAKPKTLLKFHGRVHVQTLVQRRRDGLMLSTFEFKA